LDKIRLIELIETQTARLSPDLGSYLLLLLQDRLGGSSWLWGCFSCGL